MSEDFLGTGWRFPILPDESGRLGYADNQSDAARRLGATVDQQVRIRRA